MKRVLLLCLFSCLFLFCIGQKSRLPVNAPINPEYLKAINDPEADQSPGTWHLPYHPSFSALSQKQHPSHRFTLPATYDMRTAGPAGSSLVTPVKNQGNCGSCWAFSSLAAVESTWMLKGYGSFDLSENNVKNCHGFLAAPCGYGSNFHPSAMFARGDGPMLEADDPYSTTNGTCLNGLTPAALITEILYIPPNVDDLKRTIYEHGGVSMPIRISAPYYMNATDYTYINTLHTSTNHLVTLVGWDDTKQVTGGLISAYPPKGAFIVKNSYGTVFGESGFFYISYYDLHVLDWGVCWSEREDYNPGTKVYTHSQLGSFYSTGYIDPLGYGLVKLNIDAHSQLVRLGTFLNASMAEISFEVYDDFDDVNLILSNKISEITRQYCEWPGYYTFELPLSESFTASNDIYVKVKYFTPGNNEPIPIEIFMSGFCDPAIESNSCWVSGDGQDGNWFLVGGTTSYLYDLCIYAYTETLTNWTGAVNTAWNNPFNWDYGVPDESIHARIPNTALMPTITGAESCRSVMIDNAMTLTIAVGGSLTVDKELAVYGTLNNSGSLITDANASIAYLGPGAQQIDGNIHSAGHLIINNPSGVTMNTSIQVQEQLTMTAGTISAGLYSISYAPGATLLYNGSSAQITTSAEFPSTSRPEILCIDNVSGVTLHAARTLDSTLLLYNGAFNNSTNNITLSNDQKIVRYNGSLSAAPVFGASLDLDYRSSTSIGTGNEVPSGSTIIQTLSINCPQTVSLNSNLTVNAALNLNTGIFNNSSSTLSLASGIQINVRTGSLSAVPDFGGTLDLSYLGGIAYASGNEIPSSSTAVQDLLMKNSGGLTLNSNLTVNSTLMLVSGSLDNSSSSLSLANNASIMVDPGLLDCNYGYPGALTAKPLFSSNVNLEYGGRWGLVTGFELPDSSDYALNNLSINNYTSLWFIKNIYAKGNVEARGKLRMGDFSISGPGNLHIKRQAIVHTNNVYGIDNTNGVFQLSGTSIYNDTLDFNFEGSNAQFIGIDIPVKMRHLIINNSSTGGVTLQSKDIRVMGNMVLEAGSLFNLSTGRHLDVD